MSGGWSSIGTFVSPGKSIKVRSTTFGEYIFKLMGDEEIPFLPPTSRSVSASISFLISLNL
jgi:hypothetical protein